jgi:hypothetical protein
MKMPSFVTGLIASSLLTLSLTSRADPPGGGFRGANFRGGLVAHSPGTTFRTGYGVHRNLRFHPGPEFNQNRRPFHRDRRVFFSQFVWPGYWYPFVYPDDYSYLDYGPEDEYQYGDDSARSLQSESYRTVADHGPSVIVINAGNPRPTDSASHTADNDSGSSATNAAWQQRRALQNSNETVGPPADPGMGAPPRVPQAAQTPSKVTQTSVHPQAGTFGNLVVISWLEDGGKDVIYVQNTETNEIQKITSEPNLDQFRIIELHRNSDPKLFEAVISNGSQEGTVRFRF